MEQQDAHRGRQARTQHAGDGRHVDGSRRGSYHARRQRNRQYLDEKCTRSPFTRSLPLTDQRPDSPYLLSYLQAGNKWQWAKILDASDRKADDSPSCLAFWRDRIAIGYPKSGVKVWLFIQGACVYAHTFVLPAFHSSPCLHSLSLGPRYLASAALYTAAECDRDQVRRRR